MRLPRSIVPAVLATSACLTMAACGSSSKPSAPSTSATSGAAPVAPTTSTAVSSPSPAAASGSIQLNKADATARIALRETANLEETYFTDYQLYTTKFADLTSYGPTADDQANVTIAKVDPKNSYCLKAKTPGTTIQWWYDSNNGGVTTAACA